MEHKTFKFEIKDVTTNSNNDIGIIRGFASTFGNVDREGDIIASGAFTDTLDNFIKNKQKIPMLSAHNFEKLIGGYDATSIQQTEKGLEVIGEIDLNTQDGKEKHSLAQKGFLNSFSIGFTAHPEDVEYMEGIRTFKKVELYEISLVAVPANPKAVITSVKAAVAYKNYPLMSENTDWDSSKSRKQTQNKTGSEDSASSTYRNGFMWFDSSKSDNLTSYKLPFVYVVDGQFKAVPRGIFAIRAVLSGSRGGVDIPASDRTAVERNVNGYYKKMDRDIPFPDAGTPSGAKNFTIDEEWVISTKVSNVLDELIVGCKLDNIISSLKNGFN